MTLLREMAAEQALAVYKEGSLRVCPPEETLARVAPIAQRLGVVRVTDLTPFDTLGVPVFQAVRRDARSVALSHGKGITRIGAKVGAYTEAIERWHAEHVALETITATIGEMAPDLGYRLEDCVLHDPCFLSRHSRLEWVRACNLTTGAATYLPRDLLSMDFRATGAPALPRFASSSNGLAIGNSLTETALHAACEVLERDAIARNPAQQPTVSRRIVLDTIDAPRAASLIAQLRARGAKLAIEDITGPTGIATLRVFLWHGAGDPISGGFGCHPEAEVALLRALTEATQSRMGYVCGLSATLNPGYYAARTPPATVFDPPGSLDWRTIPSTSDRSLRRNLDRLVARVRDRVGQPVLLADLRHPDIGIPVVSVVIPGLLFNLA